MANLTWYKVPNTDITKEYAGTFQNIGRNPDGYVYIAYVADGDPDPTTDADIGFILTSGKYLPIHIPLNTNLWYTYIDGGVPSFFINESIKLINYDVATIHEQVTLSSTLHTIDVPEGSMFVIQNLSDEFINFRMQTGSNASFALLKNQMFSTTMTKATTVTIDGYPNYGQLVSYMVAQSPSVTQLSDETQVLIEDMRADLNWLMANSVDQGEIDSILNSIANFGYSNDFITQITTNLSIISTSYIITNAATFSAGLNENDPLDVFIQLKVKVRDDNNNLIAVNGYILFTTTYNNADLANPIISNIRYSNTILRDIVDAIHIEWENANPDLSQGLKIDLVLNRNVEHDAINTGLMVTTLNNAGNSFIESLTPFNTSRVIVYAIHPYNEEVNFVTSEELTNFINEFINTTPDNVIKTSNNIIEIINNSNGKMMITDFLGNIITSIDDLGILKLKLEIPLATISNINDTKPIYMNLACVDVNGIESNIGFNIITGCNMNSLIVTEVLDGGSVLTGYNIILEIINYNTYFNWMKFYNKALASDGMSIRKLELEFSTNN